MERTSKLALLIFRVIAAIAVAGGGLITFYLVFQAGGNNKSILLLFLFVVWDLSPFAVLMAANSVSTHWPAVVKIVLYALMIVIAVGSVIYYWNIAWLTGPARTRPFLIIPLISWLMIVVIIPASAAFVRRKSGTDDDS